MRVLITTLHVHPLVPVAHALRDAGHEVAIACSQDNRQAVEAASIRFLPAGTAMRELMPSIPDLPPQERELWVIRNLFGRMLPERMIPDLLSICDEWQPDLIVRDMTDIAGCVVAEARGFPHASVEVGAFVPAPMVAMFAGESIAMLRQSLGLTPDPRLDMLYRHLHLSFVPPSYQDPEQPLPTTAQALRTVTFDQSGDERLPEWVHELPDRPTVHVTLGTAFNHQPELFRAIVAGLGDEPFNVIVTVGRDLEPARLGPLPENTRVERYIPQTLLLPHCNLVVCHGGWNTVMASLSYGLPLVVAPLGADQPQNASRVASLGCGRVLGPQQRTPDQFRAAVREVLYGPSYRHNAAGVRRAMESLPGPERAVELLEQLVASREVRTAA